LHFVVPASGVMALLSRTGLPGRTDRPASVFLAAFEEPRPDRLFGHGYCQVCTVPMFFPGSRDDTRRSPGCSELHADLRPQSSARATDFGRATSAARHMNSHCHIRERDETLGGTRGRVLGVHERIS
jgi:hypothetical protein